jgi:hypothetical protein
MNYLNIEPVGLHELLQLNRINSIKQALSVLQQYFKAGNR